MTETATDQQRIEVAAQSVAAKLQTLHAGLTPDEQQVLALALQQSGAGAEEAAGDTTGYFSVLHLPSGAFANPVIQTAIAIEQVKSVLAGLGIPWTPPSQGPGR
jgi:hypothetical protein